MNCTSSQFYNPACHDWGVQCRGQQPTTQRSDVYNLFFSRNNVARIADRVQSMGFPRPCQTGEGLYRQLHRLYELYPGYQGVPCSGGWGPSQVGKHVDFLNDQLIQWYMPDMVAKQMLYDAYDRDRLGPLRPPATPILDSTHRRCSPMYIGDRLR